MKDCKQLMKNVDKSSNVENGTKQWCSYSHFKYHLNEDFHQQQSQPAKILEIKDGSMITSHSDDKCYHQINSKRSSLAESKSTKYKTFVVDSNVTGCDKV